MPIMIESEEAVTVKVYAIFQVLLLYIKSYPINDHITISM